jgi:hypothetical protein
LPEGSSRTAAAAIVQSPDIAPPRSAGAMPPEAGLPRFASAAGLALSAFLASAS